MPIWKSRGISNGRYVPDLGIDFSVAEALTLPTAGTCIKFKSGATLGYNRTSGEWEKGIILKETLSAGTLVGTEGAENWKGMYGRAFEIAVNTTSTKNGHTQGACFLATFTREAAYAHTGGSEDIAARVIGSNYATLTLGGIRGLNVEAMSKTGTVAKVQGMLVTAHQKDAGHFTVGLYGARIVSKNRQPTGGTGYQHALEVADESDGVQPAENSIIFIEKHSNSNTLDTKAAVEICNNALTGASKVITHGIYFKCGVANSNITNAFGFDSTDGTDGATMYAGTITGSGNMARIAIKVGTVTYHILAHASVDH